MATDLKSATPATSEYVLLDGEEYFKIANSHQMPDFFMSIVGASDHWMFVSSNSSLTAGRRNPDNALFPYASDDQISAARAYTGSLTKIRMATDDGEKVWQPFSPSPAADFEVRQNLYKTPLGNKLVFEEVNESLNLTFRYRWAFSHKFGFVRSCRLENTGSSTCSFALLDGIQNVLPFGVESEFMMRFSNLANAYKKNELLEPSNVGIYYLSSIPSDKAEPSEGLRATTVWQTGLNPSATLLSTSQLPAFERADAVHHETDERGKAGAYLCQQTCELAAGESLEWHLIAEVCQDHSAIVALDHWLSETNDPADVIAKDIADSQQEFIRIVGSSDGMQLSSNRRRSNRHMSNTVFNVMRGGIPLENYDIPADDFRSHIAKFNRLVSETHGTFLAALPETIAADDLRDQVTQLGDSSLTRLCLEYLPLAFSRRHGDPSRPWNRFSIDLRSKDEKTSLNYQGNWRDIFQNWEALGLSFPNFSTAMICRFLNATTADGYNPYRVTKDGFEWEAPSPEDPWANIGYWGDHQIIYLLKLLEWARSFHPAGMDELLSSSLFTHANIPYRIKSYDEIRKDPQDTIVFDFEEQKKIDAMVDAVGADGKLIRNNNGDVHHVTLVEKLLTLSLAKLSNFIPDGGIWLNTQRPEWNDANNALVGNGLSMVTTCYLYRWFGFLHQWIESTTDESFAVSTEVAKFFAQISEVLESHLTATDGKLAKPERAKIVDALSTAGSDYRNGLYASGLSGDVQSLERSTLLNFFETSRKHLAATIHNNKRADGLYHAYNLLDQDDDGVGVEYLYEMLEGQVAILSSGLLSASEAVSLLDALRSSALYRENQNSYLLYPDRQLPRFLKKNCVSREFVESSELVKKLVSDGNEQVVQQDIKGVVHFNGDFRNSSDLNAAMQRLADSNAAFKKLVDEEGDRLAQEFEEIFAHRQFTGRSGTFFGYEGLGSIYWHMVSKLGIAVVENFYAAIEKGEPKEIVESLRSHFHAVRDGIGAEKSPENYGAFPTDPYSHTPENAGVKQPGMTGQVKEDILSRFAEVGVHIEDGCLHFRMNLFDRQELIDQATEFEYYDVAGQVQKINVPENGFAYTIFQVPVIYSAGDFDSITVKTADGKEQSFKGKSLDLATSRQLFARTGEIKSVHCKLAIL